MLPSLSFLTKCFYLTQYGNQIRWRSDGYCTSVYIYFHTHSPDTINQPSPPRSFGPSGTVEVHDTMCILAVNIINQKIYILLWFWLVSLSVITGLWLLFRIATILSPHLRAKLLQVWTPSPPGTCLLIYWHLIQAGRGGGGRRL